MTLLEELHEALSSALEGSCSKSNGAKLLKRLEGEIKRKNELVPYGYLALLPYGEMRFITSETVANEVTGNGKYGLVKLYKRDYKDSKLSQCSKCGGRGLRDLGGVYPWGEATMEECDCGSEFRDEVLPAEIAKAEEALAKLKN